MRVSNPKALSTPRNNRFVFFREFLKHPLQIASIIPSSRFLERHLVKTAGVSSAKSIVELGPGTGGTTREILRAMSGNAKLLSIETNPNFHSLVSRIDDDRLIAHLGSAHKLKEIIYKYGLEVPDVVISGIPFSTTSHALGSQIIKAVSSTLAPSGRFVAYQASRQVVSLCRPLLGSEQVEVELFNIPPMRVYRWEKNDI